MREEPTLGTIVLPVAEGRDNLWNKTKEALKYIYKHHLTDADWFLKADDDTYVILENLRSLLHSYSSNVAIYFGCRLKLPWGSKQVSSQFVCNVSNLCTR